MRTESDAHLGTMVCYHRRHMLGDAHGFVSMADAARAERLREVDGEVALVLPLYLYDHSELTMATKPFSCPFDSGKVGFIYATYNAIRKAYGKQRLSKKLIERARECLVDEVAQYNAELR